MAATVNIGGKKSGAWLVRWALEQLPVTHTFGIPGVHNTEIYDELNKSERIHPVLVTHEAGASFIASKSAPIGGRSARPATSSAERVPTYSAFLLKRHASRAAARRSAAFHVFISSFFGVRR